MNEQMLKPSIGHPNNAQSLIDLDKQELARQVLYANEIGSFLRAYKLELIRKYKRCMNELESKHFELLIKFDDVLTLEEIKLHGIFVDDF